MKPGIHLLHKPPGPTSFSIVQSCIASMPTRPNRRPLRLCHGGTLDPFASGLLLILVEPATRLFDYLHAVPKVYDATVRWGTETDNGDPGGKITFTGDASNLTEQQLEESLAPFIGWHDQIPHATSAKRIGGERAYLKAHRGEEVIMPPSRVYLHSARWLSHDLPHQSRLELTAGGGYYIRAMVRDLGRQLGCGAHLTQLHRSAIGPWTDPGLGNTVEIHARKSLPWLRWRILSDFEVGELRRDKVIDVGEFQPSDWELPAGFPEAKPFVRAFHLDKFCFLLTPTEDTKMRSICDLRGGV
jgi:tRNA pseudouridine55 synthase